MKEETSNNPLPANDGNVPVSGSGEFMDRNCPNCKTVTKQEVKLYNPDNSEDGEVWECTKCKENTGWAD